MQASEVATLWLPNNATTITVPDICVGGTETVTWTITDLCDTIEVTATYTYTAPPAIDITCPEDVELG